MYSKPKEPNGNSMLCLQHISAKVMLNMIGYFLTRGKLFGVDVWQNVWWRVMCGKMLGDNVTCAELWDCGTED